MNSSTEKALDRLLRKTARPPRERRRGFSRAPLILGLGLILAYQLLVRLLPAVWAVTLPGGLEGARQLQGPPGLLLRLALACHRDFPTVVYAIVGAVGGGLLLARLGWPVRLLLWLLAAGMIVVNAGILVIAIGTALRATAAASGIGL